MKKLILTIILLCFAPFAFAGDLVEVKQVFTTQTVAASGAKDSKPINLNDYMPYGVFSLQATITGSGTCKFEYVLSLNGTDFREPLTATDIATGQTASSGPESDGKIYVSFRPELGKYMKIRVTETGTSSSVIISAWLGVH